MVSIFVILQFFGIFWYAYSKMGIPGSHFQKAQGDCDLRCWPTDPMGESTAESPLEIFWLRPLFQPIGSMYGIYIYANIGGILMVNVTIYSIHGSYGQWLFQWLNPLSWQICIQRTPMAIFLLQGTLFLQRLLPEFVDARAGPCLGRGDPHSYGRGRTKWPSFTRWSSPNLSNILLLFFEDSKRMGIKINKMIRLIRLISLRLIRLAHLTCNPVGLP